MSDSSTGCSVGPTCQTSMNVSEEVGVAPGRAALLDPVTEVRERAAASATAPTHARSTGTSIGGVEYRDTKPTGWLECRLGERLGGRRRPPRIAGLVPCHDVEQVGRILDRPRERPGGGQALQRSERGARNPSARRLQPEQPAARGRNADRASAVGRVRCRNETGRERCGGTSARPTRRQLGVPRIPRRPVELGLRERDRPELGRVRLADDNEARLEKSPHDGEVEVGDVLGVRSRGVGRPDTGGRREILDPDRHAAKRGVAGGRVDGSRSLERLVRAHGDERVEGRVEPLDALERRRHELPRGDLSCAHEPGLVDCREERELHRGEATSVVRQVLAGTLGEMSQPTAARDVTSERLDLLDWKRKILICTGRSAPNTTRRTRGGSGATLATS